MWESGQGRNREQPLIPSFPLSHLPTCPPAQTGGSPRCRPVLCGLRDRCIAAMLATQARHEGGVEPPQPGCGVLADTGISRRRKLERGSATRGRWGEATDEPAREYARPTDSTDVLRLTESRSGKWTGIRVALSLLRFGRPACVPHHPCPMKQEYRTKSAAITRLGVHATATPARPEEFALTRTGRESHVNSSVEPVLQDNVRRVFARIGVVLEASSASTF